MKYRDLRLTISGGLLDAENTGILEGNRIRERAGRHAPAPAGQKQIAQNREHLMNI